MKHHSRRREASTQQTAPTIPALFISPEHFRGKAMQQDSGIQFQDTDQVLRNAQLRRSADLGPWLRQRFSSKAGRLVVATSLACMVVVLAIVAAPRPVSSAALGSEWQCSKTAFVLTTCRQADPPRS
ncbi:hypothetical protein [Bradyrhizobium brasilense]|uniref:hypothetical protein n=1 Tax=Bradyrhizobium brasilense TaxID=1419277 RepID=UPI001E2AFF35|nr:hypothetical protein [Bradyrhizobium brasilense]MCC8974434.1 hypothetical protein [Bradyrhizobium brasilense]